MVRKGSTVRVRQRASILSGFSGSLGELGAREWGKNSVWPMDPLAPPLLVSVVVAATVLSRGCRETLWPGMTVDRRRRCQKPAAGSGRGELVSVELGEVVGGHQQPPFGPHCDPASSMEPVDPPVVFGVREHGLDHLDSLAVELSAVL